MTATLTLTGETFQDIFFQMQVIVSQQPPMEIIPTRVEEAPLPDARPEVEAKPRRAHRRVNPVGNGKAKEEPAEAPVEEATGPAEPEEVFEVEIVEEEQPDAGPQDSLADLKLKEEVLASLHTMFLAGNVKRIREILTKYGHGAKSFPEVEAKHFAEIKKAIAA